MSFGADDMQADALAEFQGLTILRFADLPGLAVIQTTSQAILALAFVVSLIREGVRLLREGRAEWTGPVLKTATGYLLISFLPQIGGHLVGLTVALSKAMAEQNSLALFGRALRTAMGRSYCNESGWMQWLEFLDALTSIKFLVFAGSAILHVLMFLAKFVVIDVLFPVTLGLVLYSGLLAVPLGMFPGLDSTRGWVKNLVEVSLWPVLFQLLVALLAGTFPLMIGAMADGRIIMDCGEAAAATAAASGVPASPYPSGWLAVLKFDAICVVYLVMVLFTPYFARVVMRSETAGYLGGVMIAKGTSLATWSGGFALKVATKSMSTNKSAGQGEGGGGKSGDAANLNKRDIAGSGKGGASGPKAGGK